MRSKKTLPVVFVLISIIVFLLGFYLFAVNANFNLKSIIVVCSEVLKGLQNRVYFSLDGFFSLLILLIISIGFSLMLRQLFVFMVSYKNLNKNSKTNKTPLKLTKIIRKHNLKNISFYILDSSKFTAYTTGFFKSKIFISKHIIINLSFQQLESVVLHEVYHVRSFHIWWLIISKLASSLLFFVPIIEHLAGELRLEFELAADSFAIKKQKTNDHLCASLLLNLKSKSGVIPYFATPPIEKRIEYLVSGKIIKSKMGYKKIGISVVVMLIMFGLVTMRPASTNAKIDCSNTYESNTLNFSPAMLFSYQQ